MKRHFTNRVGSLLVVGLSVLAGGLLGGGPAVGDVIVFENEHVQMIRLTQQQAEEYLVKSVFRNQRSVDAARQTAERALGQQVEHVGQIVALSDAQRAKLELAGQGDICRFFNEFDVVLQSAPLGPLPQQQWQQAWQETSQKLQPLQAQYGAGLHGEGSLFRKTIPSALSSEQILAFQKMEDERNRKRYRALVKATLAAIDKNVPLTAAQREQIINLLLEKTSPPPDFVESGNQSQFVLYQMSQIEDDLRPLFTDKEWPRMQRILRQGKVFEQLMQQQQFQRVWDLQGRRLPGNLGGGLRFRVMQGGAILEFKQWEVDRAPRVEAFDRAREAQERARRAVEIQRLRGR